MTDWQPGEPFRPPTDRYWRICIGALNESHEGFDSASPARGSIEEAQALADVMARGRGGGTVYIEDVLSGEVWQRDNGKWLNIKRGIE